MVDSNPPSSPANTNAVSNATAAATTSEDSISPWIAGVLGGGLVVLGLGVFVGSMALMSSSMPSSLGFGAIAGVALLSVTLIGLIVLSRAVGLADGTQALGLPNGSVRAILALVFAIVFVAVASWTLGGMYNPFGAIIYEGEIAGAKLDEFKKSYPTDQYIVTEMQVAGKDAVAVKAYLRKDHPPPDLTDMAKQIVTISATVLVTIVGFYFGSKSSSDAVKSVSATISSMQKAISDASGSDDDGPSPSDGAPPSADDVKKSINTISAFASSMKGKFTSLGDTPLETLKSAIANSKGTVAPSVLADAESSFVVLQDRLNLVLGNSDQANSIGANVESASPSALKDLASQAGALLDASTKANHDFEEALTKFGKSRTAILSAIAI